MNSLNLDAIYQAKRLFNDNISFIYHSNNYSNLKLNELLNRNLTLFWTTMHQCLDLNDLIQQQVILLNHSIVIATINQTSHNLFAPTQLQSLYTWCNLGRSTWFTNVFTLMHHNSWQEKVSIKLQKYLLPILLFMNRLSLLTSITGIYHLCKLSNKSNQKIMILMRCQSIIENYFPATWPLLLWYCIIGLLWLLLIFGLNMMTSHQYFNIHISIHSHDNYCRIITYLKNILRYIPTWLMSLMLCDRAIGEYRNRNHIYTMIISCNHHDESIINKNRLNQLSSQYCNQCITNQSINNQLIIPKIIYNNDNNNVTSYDMNDPDQYHSLSKRSYFHTFLLYFKKKLYFDCILYGLKQTSKKQFQSLNRNNDYVISCKECSNPTTNHDYERLLNDLCHWNECGLSRIAVKISPCLEMVNNNNDGSTLVTKVYHNTMNSLNLDAIYQAKRLFNDNISFIYHSNNYSDLKLNELLNRNLTLFWSTMRQCLDLNDLIQQQVILLNHSIVIATMNQTSHNLFAPTQLQSLYTWCNLGRSTWFTNVFTLMHHNSWQEKVSIKLQKYLLPILLFMNRLSLLTSITGIYHLCKLSNKSNQKIMILMRCQSIIENYFPATWPLLLWYCTIDLLWLLLIFGLNMMTSHQVAITPLHKQVVIRTQ
ncbi:unnamed protein product [Schistosoma bovis]|nr:unnamed protein product [Schistosoma bovis]